ncbi:hypothetical protein RF240_20905 [Dickeya dadantii]
MSCPAAWSSPPRTPRELWHCLEGLGIKPFDPDAAASWINHYPGGLTFAG